MLTDGVPSIPEFRPVSEDVFEARAKRLRDLARAHAMGEYLRFAATLSQAQAAEFDRTAEVPDAAQLEHCREHGLPPLSIDSPQHAIWRRSLLRLCDALEGKVLPAPALDVIAELRESDAGDLERDAEHLLEGAYAAVHPARVPFIGAALQLAWTEMAFALGEDGRSPNVDSRLCPVCGSPPVVSLVQIGGAAQGLRYLKCSLCASEWHLVRAKCSSCASTKDVSYLFVDGANDAVRAECCDACSSYLKILYLDRDPDMEAVADDLATLALDVLVDEQGYRRLGPNLLLAPGVAS